MSPGRRPGGITVWIDHGRRTRDGNLNLAGACRGAARRRHRHLSLFGSTARGEAGADSDIDLLAELDPDAHIGLIRLAGIELRIGDILGRRVDLLTEPVGKKQLRANIERDRRHVF